MSRALHTSYDAVVIGGGHNGLIAAAYLARAGQSVLVLERNTWLGGATTSQRVFPDFDAQLSRYAYLISLLSPVILSELGLRFETLRRSVASFTAYERGGRQRGLVLSNVDPGVSRASLDALTGSDRGWREYNHFQSIAQALAGLAWPGMLEPLRTRAWWKARCITPLLREGWEGIVEQPLGHMLERHVDDDILRGLLFTDGKIGVLTDPDDPTLLQNRCYFYHIVGNGTGEWRVPAGGMVALVDALLSLLRSSGATVLASAPATTVHRGGARHTVTFQHHDQDHTVDARRVLLATGARTTARLLGEAWTPVEENEGSVVKANMLLRRLPRLKAGIDPATAFTGSFHVDEGYAAMRASAREARAGQVPARPPFETYCHSLTDPSILGADLNTRGFHTLTLFGLDAPYRTFAADNAGATARFRTRYLEAMDRVADEPFLDCLARDSRGEPCLEVKSPVDLEHEVDLDAGNIFHTAPTWFFTDDPALEGTWGVETRWPGVYRCGSSVIRGGAVSGIPGRAAARCILSEEGIT